MSMQDKTGRVRPPRVHISYKVETLDGMKEVELPFVVGVLADLTGKADPDNPLPPLRDRKFEQIDRDNFNTILKEARPRVAIRVPNRLTEDGTQLSVSLSFEKIEDFEPAQIAKQVPPLNKLLETREKLSQLLSLTENYKVEQLMNEIISNTEKANQLAKDRGISADSQEEESSGETPPEKEEPKAEE